MADDTQSTSSSVSAFVSVLILNLIIFAIFISVFIIFKRKQLRIYEPRATVDPIKKDLKVEKQNGGVFTWFSDLLSKSETYIIEKSGIDGYFFLRYLRIFSTLGVIGGLFLWPILFAVNATGGGGKQGFDIISYANLNDKYRSFAQVFTSWLFFGLVIYTIYKELIYYISFRHAAETSPKYAELLASKTMFIDNVPESSLNDSELTELFPTAIRFWFGRNTKDLQKLVKERTKLSGKYEGALNKVIKKSMKLRQKAIKKNKPIPEPSDELVSYIPEKKQPTHRLKFLIGEKVKTLIYGPERIGELNNLIDEEQQKYPDGFDKTGGVFLEFPNALELQRAYQSVDYNPIFKNSRKFTGVGPEDVCWDNLGLSWSVRNGKNILAKTILTLTIIFWSIPVAVVGCISNINFLTEKVHFLRFINNMPDVLMGIITGMLPTIALAVLMSLLPPFISYMGKIGGCLTHQENQRWTQNWFFAFQVVQVFLVTTCTSAASSSVVDIINDPSSAMTLLGQNLPPASNFYICYMLLQGLSISSGALAQIVPLILYHLLGKFLDGTPRKKWNRYTTLPKPNWGVTYALYGLFTVILMCYSIIAPIIIAFTSIAFFLMYVAYLYNVNYVMDHSNDSRGRNYPLALFQVFVGLYLAEICLIALFVFPKNWAAVVLEVVVLVATIASHLYFRYKFEPLLDTVPIGAFQESQHGVIGAYPMNDQGYKQIKSTGEDYSIVNIEQGNKSHPILDNKGSDAVGTTGGDALVYNDENKDLDADLEHEAIANTAEPFETTGDSVKKATSITRDSFASSDNATYHNNNNGVGGLEMSQIKKDGGDSYGSDLEKAATNNAYEKQDSYINKPLNQNNHHVNGDDDTDSLNNERDFANGGGYGDSQQPLSLMDTIKNCFKKENIIGFFKPRLTYDFNKILSILPKSWWFDPSSSFVSFYKYQIDNGGYNDPAARDSPPSIWIPKDSQGLSTRLINDSGDNVDVSDENAVIDDDLKIYYTAPPPYYNEFD
ncbi:unnamed protein product [[Candida] boidinii]|uniref:Unnamed protein product n=1 Tax=Candida boidinii TaxID=5477 RepID=A0ACB5TLV7_CANBO|nr:unnamed protein product [[Candida] boidinii]